MLIWEALEFMGVDSQTENLSYHPFWINSKNIAIVNFLNLENVSKTYGEKVLFDHIDLQVNKGQKIALVAKNGSGKSTLLRVIAGQEAAEGENAKILLRI